MGFFSGANNEASQTEVTAPALAPAPAPETEAPEVAVQESEVAKIKVGDEEYTADDLAGLVGLGKIAREAEEKFDTKIDRVWPDYGRTKEQNKQLQKELEAIKNQAATSIAEGQPEEKVLREARDAAKKVGLVLNDDLDQRFDQEFERRYQEKRETEKLLERLDVLEKEIDGSDGIRPKFDKQEILQYMMENPGFKDPKKAYKDKYEEKWGQWQAKTVMDSKRGIYTEERGATAKEPKKVDFTKANLKSQIAEALGIN